MEKPKITFGIIVLNGNPFVKYCLRSIYPFAYEIIVIEGGHESTKSVTTADGHSIDGTLQSLYEFKEEEDPENKLQIITKKGHWPQKDELGNDRTPQCQAYAERATGDYLWQIDIDEFYKPEDMQAVINLLLNDPSISMVSFMTYTFWGGIDYVADCWQLRRGSAEYHRLFKWGKNYKYVTHEPPTVIDEMGRNLRELKWVRGKDLLKKNIFMFHYSLLFPAQVMQKTVLYKEEKPDYCEKIDKWANNCYFKLGNPYRVHNLYNSPSWLERYLGNHPTEISKMMSDIFDRKISCELRRIDDIEILLNSNNYHWGITYLKILNNIDFFFLKIRYFCGKMKRELFKTKKNEK
jgi:hypothetical protein